MTTMTRRSGPSVGLILIAAVLVASLGGCGDDGDGSRATPTSAPTTAPQSTPTTAPPPTATVLANQPPVLAPIGDHTVAVGNDLLIALSATDPEGQAVAFSVVGGLPEDSYFLPKSGVFCIFPSAASSTPIEITFRASDGEQSDEQTITIRVVEPGGTTVSGPVALVLDPIGNHTVRAGQTLTLQLAASGAQPITYKMIPEPMLAPLVTLDATSGRFQFAPTIAQAGNSFEITFQACVPDGPGCSATAQVHETVHLTVEPASQSCPDYVPASCTELMPGMTLPQPVRGCFVVRQAGAMPYVHDIVNILAGGGLYFVENPGRTIDFQVKSLLVEQGGVLQAGSPNCPFGNQGGTLSLGLYGDDPSMQATVPNPPPGIQCLTNPTGHDGAARCFPPDRDPEQGSFYCTVSNSSDPCSATMAPATDPNNALLEHYGNLNFDPTPWGYKVLGVSYGGSIRLFGHKGAKPLQDPAWGGQYDSGPTCVVPSAQQSTLDAAEMQAWADLTGSSWTRLQAINSERTQLTLDRVVSDWAAGDQIVVGTTDWYPGHSEVRTIRSAGAVSTTGGMRTQLTLCRPTAGGTGPGGCAANPTPADALDYPHSSELFDASVLASQHGAEYTGPVNRSAADLRAPVGLLSRSIRIRSLGAMPQMQPGDPGFPDVSNCLYGDGTLKPECYFGGHLMVRQGFRAAQLQGVEFKQLGQGGRIGHYPVHFHLAKSTAYTAGQAFLKDSAVWDSMTRFATVHGTHEVTLARNVGYLSVGHGYYLEDGSEIDNLLCHNLGVAARGALKEYYSAAGDQKNWLGTPPAPSLAARYVPPILDGVCPGPNAETCIRLDPPPPPPTPNPGCTSENRCGPTLRTGSDTYMPVMYWAMNAYNEFVGNAAVGVHGFGSCFWLLGSGVSGPSTMDHQFDGYASYNRAGQYQAPLLRFRGNSCSTATYGLAGSAEVSPAALGEAQNTGYTAVDNPYIAGKTVGQLMGNYARPAVVGNFQPIPIQAQMDGITGCANSGQSNDDLEKNTKACVTTLIDRFTTSYNWAERNYGSIWLRPWFYLLLNSAVTDQLFGGVTFVSAGSWVQVPPAYFSLAKNSLFVGTSQHGGSPYAQRSGPIFRVTSADNPARYAPCAMGGNITCNLLAEGTGFWTGGFQPKRLINIYDGPHFADGNLFVNVGSWECDPQPCLGRSPCDLTLPCGIYSSTTQPVPSAPDRPVDPHKMVVLDAAVGWKQPNGFYYPPAFTYRGSTFFKKLPTGLPDPDPANPLNQCFSFGPDDGYMRPKERPGDCRHYVIDRTQNYIQGSMLALNGGPGVFPAANNLLPTTPIDFSTILIDLDGTLTGADGMISGIDGAVPTHVVEPQRVLRRAGADRRVSVLRPADLAVRVRHDADRAAGRLTGDHRSDRHRSVQVVAAPRSAPARDAHGRHLSPVGERQGSANLRPDLQ